MQAATEFPYGLDPRDYGLNRVEYDRALDHHRKMEHHDWLARERAQHDHEMTEARARKAAAEAELAAKGWWLQPVNAFVSLVGGAFWFAAWMLIILSVMLSINEWQQKRDAQWCLKDVAKCEAIAKGAK